MRIPISYPIRNDAPGWPGNEVFEIEYVRRIDEGAVSNSCIFRMHEHYGTHMDAPFHFNNNGPKMAELPSLSGMNAVVGMAANRSSVGASCHVLPLSEETITPHPALVWG